MNGTPPDPPKVEPVPENNRSPADSPPPPLEPLSISNVQVQDVTSSGARITWQTNVPAQTQTAFGLDAPTVWTQPSGDSLIEHQSVVSGLEFSTTYQVYLHAVDEWNRALTADGAEVRTWCAGARVGEGADTTAAELQSFATDVDLAVIGLGN